MLRWHRLFPVFPPGLSAGSPAASPLKTRGGFFQKTDEDLADMTQHKRKPLARSKTGTSASQHRTSLLPQSQNQTSVSLFSCPLCLGSVEVMGCTVIGQCFCWGCNSVTAYRIWEPVEPCMGNCSTTCFEVKVVLQWLACKWATYSGLAGLNSFFFPLCFSQVVWQLN